MGVLVLVARHVRTFGLLAALLAVGALVPAAAVTDSGRTQERHGLAPASWSAPQRVADGTGTVPLATGPDGSTWGVTRLPGPYAVVPRPTRLVLLHRVPRGAWSRRLLPVTGFPLGVADDGRSTHVLYRDVVCGAAPDGCRLHLLTVPHGGVPTRPRQLQRGDVVGASIAADERGWWAAWTLRTFRRSDRSTAMQVRSARSSAPASIALVPPAPDTLGPPSLSLRGAEAVLAVVRETPRGAAVEVWRASAAGPPVRAAALPMRPGTYDAGLAVSGGRTSVTFWDATRLVLAQDRGDLRFAQRVVPTRTDPRALPPVIPRSWPVAASAGRVFVGYDTCAAPDGERLTCRTWVVQARGAGPLRETEVSAAVQARGSRPLAVLSGLTAGSGRAVVAMESPLFDPFIGPTATPGVFVRTSR